MNISKDEEVLKLYNVENKSTYEIAEIFNTYPNKIRRILKKHGCKLKTKSDAQKNAMDNGRSKCPTKGRERSYEEKLKISAGVQKRWENMSDEEREKIKVAARERWENLSDSKRQQISTLAIEAIRKAGKEGSKLEKFIMKGLSDAGYAVEFHKKNLIPTENLEIDLIVPELKTIIEVDGPSHYYPIWGEEKLQKQIKADLHKTGILLSRGYVVIRVLTLSQPSLKSREDLLNKIIDHLQNIKTKFPKKSDRFIEVKV